MRVMCSVWMAVLALTPSLAHAQYAPVYPPYGAPYPYGRAAPPYYPPYNSSPYPPPYPSPYPPPQSGPPISLAHDLLSAHNDVRARVGDPPLTWSASLAARAQDWANTLISSRTFGHRPNNRFGENLYTITGGAASPRQVVAAWADEARGYDIRSNACAGQCGHYTQIVWRATRQVGCAVASDVERQVWVCEYDPPGNVIGYRPY